MRILLAGGGSGGPVSPVLAVVEQIRLSRPKTEFLFVGTHQGPERTMVTDFGIPFYAMSVAKLRRYFSIRNFFDIFVFIFSLFTSLRVIKDFKPQVIFSAGGFVAVPLCWVGKLMGVKIVMHQQDARIGLANRLIAPFAHKITTAFEITAKSFYSGSGLFTKKWKTPAVWTGNPVRSQINDTQLPKSKLVRLNDNIPILLVLGGGTGSKQVNKVITESLPSLVKSYQVIHVTGKNKIQEKYSDINYHPYELLPFADYAYAIRKADLVITRAGLSTITELSALGKVAIIIPMPDSHQEDNAALLHFMSAAIVMDKQVFTSENLLRVVTKLTFDPDKQKLLAQNIKKIMPRGATEKIAEKIIKIGSK